METTPTNSSSDLTFLNVPDAARLMGLTEEHVRVLCNTGMLKNAKRISERENAPWQIPRSTIDEWLKIHRPPKTITVWDRLRATRLWKIIATIVAVVTPVLIWFNEITGFISNIFGAAPIIAILCNLASICTPTVTPMPSFTPVPTIVATQAILYPSPQPPPSSSFNIAVTKFLVTGKGKDVENPGDLADTFSNLFEEQINAIERRANVNFILPSKLTAIEGGSITERAKNAAEVAKTWNADIVIYGVIKLDGWAAVIEPEFYVARNDELNDGIEIFNPSNSELSIEGQYRPAITIRMTKINNPLDQIQAAEKLGSSFQVLTQLMFGIAHYSLADYDNAEKYLSLALETSQNVPEWENTDVIYVLLGNTAGARADFDKAQDLYNSAIKQNPKNPRAYIGLGSTFYIPALGNPDHNGYDDINLVLLNQAIDSYRHALQPDMQQPPLANVPSKAHFALGQSYLFKTFVALATTKSVSPTVHDFAEPIDAFQFVIRDCQSEKCEQGADFRLQSLTATSYANLGLIYYFIGDLPQASAFYNKAIVLLPTFTDDQKKQKSKYESTLKDINERLQKAPPN